MRLQDGENLVYKSVNYRNLHWCNEPFTVRPLVVQKVKNLPALQEPQPQGIPSVLFNLEEK